MGTLVLIVFVVGTVNLIRLWEEDSVEVGCAESDSEKCGGEELEKSKFDFYSLVLF